MKLNDIYVWLEAQAHKAAQEAFTIQSQDIYARIYLWHRRGELRAAVEMPAGFELSNPERLPRNITVAQQAQWIAQVARQLPCLPIE